MAAVSKVAKPLMAWTGRTAGAPLADNGPLKKDDFAAGVEREMAMLDLASLSPGDLLDVSMPDGRVLTATVNISREDLPTTWVMAAGFENNSGGLTLRQDKQRTALFGRIVRVNEPIAYTVATDGNGVVWATERWRKDLLPACAPPLDPQVSSNASTPQSAPGPMGAPPPILNSKPDATAVLYIDFDGEAATTYPDWPSSNPGGVSFACTELGFTTQQMTDMWTIIAEDYAPFNINVTTDASRYSDPNAVGRRMRCIVAGSTGSVTSFGAGLAWVSSFRPGTVRQAGPGEPPAGVVVAGDCPCWVTLGGYPNATANRHRIMADAVAHEFGHTLGLSHDGPGSSGYYPGHGTAPFDWAPVMGNYRGSGDNGITIVQWSKGEYANADNTEDDLAILSGTANGFGYRGDESTDIATAVPITLNGATAGVISNNADYDYFSLGSIAAGTVNITVTSGVATTAQARNLDVGLQLLNSSGTPVATVTPGDSMEATINTNVPAGTYYLQVFGTSYLTASTGYTDYGSLGSFSISGTIPPPPDFTAPVVAISSPSHNSTISAITSLSGTATDAGGSGIAGNSVNLTLFQVSTGKYWNGSSWASSATSLSVPVTGGTWTYSGTLPNNSGNGLAGQYTLSASTIDNSGNASQPQSGVNNISFTVETTPPLTQIFGPANGSTISTPSFSFNGKATDNQGINRVILFIRRLSDNLYWDGGAWISEPLSANLSSSYNPGDDTWTCNDTLPVPGGSLGNGSYDFIALAFDNAGNTHQADSFVSVDFHQVYQWTAGSYSDLDPNNNNLYWGNPANWSPNGIPGSEDIVYIDLDHAVRSTVSRIVYGFNMSTGALDFDNDTHSLTIRKSGNWTGGTLCDSVHIQSAATFALSGTGIKQIAGSSVIHNSGTVTWTGPGTLRGYSNSTWNNKPGSTFTALTDGDVFSTYSSGNVFNNEPGASFVKSTGTGEAYIDEWTFNNNGAIQSSQGTIHVNTTLNLNIGSTFAGAGRILLNGTTNLGTALTSTGNPELVGTLNSTAGSFSGTNPFVWSSGAIGGNFSLLAGSVLDLTTTNTKVIGGGATINNFGRINWRAGLLQGYSNSTFNNESGGVFDATTDGDIFSSYSSGNVFNNKANALFIKSGKSAAPDGESFVDEWTFNNRGTIRSDTGTLRFHEPLNLLGGGSITRNGALAAKVRSTHYFVLTGTTTVSNITFESAGDWHGNLDAGTAGDGTIATQSGGVFEWTAGRAHNTVNIAAGSTFSITGDAQKEIGGGGVLNCAGNTTWTGTGNFLGYSNSTFVNLAGATFTAASDADWINYSSGNVFSNRAGATVTKTLGSENNRCDWAFDNQGTITVSAGAIALNNGGTSSGTFAPSGAGLVQFTGGTHSLVTTAKFQGTGKTQFLGGPVVAINPVNIGSTATTLEIAGGTVTSLAEGSFNAIGTVNWTSGSIGGTFNLTAGSSMSLTGAAGKQIDGGGVINNYGSVTWTGPGTLHGYSNSTWNNKSGSSFTMLTDGDVLSQYSSGNVFNNEAGASFVKSGGAVESYIDEWTFNNNGSIQAVLGTIHFNTGLNLNTGSSFAGAGRVLLNGTTNLAAALTSTTNPELVGTLNANAASFSGTKPFVWTSGWINGNFSLLAGSVLDLASTNTKLIGGGGTINNLGRINWKAGLLQGYSNSTLNNESGAIFDATTDGDTFSSYSSGNVFNNKAGATFVKSAGAGECFIDEWTFNNNSSIQAQQGTIHFYTALNLNIGSTFAGAGKILLNGTTNLATALTSTSNQELIGTLNATTASFSGTNPFVWSSGWINGNFSLLAGSVLDLTSGNTKVIGGASTINNLGRINWKAGLLQGYSNSTINNESGGVFDATTDGDVFSSYSGGNVFHNKAGALFLKSGKSAAPDGESFVDEWTFNNYGAIRSDTGILRFHEPLLLYGGGSITRNGALAAKVRSTYYIVLWGTTTVNNVIFEAACDWHGNLDPGTAGNGTIATQSNGVFEWTDGTAHNTVNIAAGSTFAISGGAMKQIGGGGVLNNGGIATRTGTGELRGYSNSSWVNLPGSVLNVQTSAPFTSYSGGNRLTNSGTLNIGSPLGISPLHWSFTQSATGRLNIDIGGTSGAAPDFDQFNISGDASLSGTLGVSLVNGYTPLAGAMFSAVTFGSRSGSFGTVLSPGAIWGRQYNPNDLTLVAKLYPTTRSEWAGYYFTDAGSPDALLSADPDRDGISNLLEYALGRNPLVAGNSGITAGKITIGSDTYLTLTFTRPAGDAALTDVAYTGERSGNMAAASWLSSGVVVHSVVPVPGQAKETVTLRSTQPVTSAAKDFLHLKLEVVAPN